MVTAWDGEAIKRFKDRKMTPEEQARMHEAIDRLEQAQEEVSRWYSGKIFSDSAEIIHEMREERTEQLWEAATGSPYEGDEDPS